MDKRLGAQLYSVRDLCKTKEEFEGTMKKLAEIGFKTVQLSGIPAEVSGDPLYVRSVFENYGLECVATHRAFADYDNDIGAMVDYHKKLNCKVAGIGALPIEFRGDLATLRETVKKCNEFNKRLMAEGMRFGWHNHAFEYSKLEGKFIMDVCLEEGEFSFILDTYWLACVGIDPAKFIRDHGERISVIHYKDLMVTDKNEVRYTEVGSGTLNWDDIVASSVKPDCAVIELDRYHINDDPIQSLSMSYKFLTERYDFT